MCCRDVAVNIRLIDAVSVAVGTETHVCEVPPHLPQIRRACTHIGNAHPQTQCATWCAHRRHSIYAQGWHHLVELAFGTGKQPVLVCAEGICT
jgi:hypothetical protein